MQVLLQDFFKKKPFKICLIFVVVQFHFHAFFVHSQMPWLYFKDILVGVSMVAIDKVFCTFGICTVSFCKETRLQAFFKKYHCILI